MMLLTHLSIILRFSKFLKLNSVMRHVSVHKFLKKKHVHKHSGCHFDVKNLEKRNTY